MYSVQELIYVLAGLTPNTPIVVWSQGLIYPIKITQKDGYYVISADRTKEEEK